MARQLRPRVLAVGFGIYFAIIGIGSWQFAQSLPGPWYPADITRWVYTTYMLVAAIFLVGLAGLGLSIRASFSRQLRESQDRKSTRLNSSHVAISYAVFCLKKKKTKKRDEFHHTQQTTGPTLP